LSERLPVTFTRRANRHIEQASAWWERNRLKAPLAIPEDVEEVLELISTQPHIGALAKDVDLADVRRVFLNRVGYYLYYRVIGEPPTSIEVVALWHARRAGGPKL
jgi:plasmid stabilization system protein ParE